MKTLTTLATTLAFITPTAALAQPGFSDLSTMHSVGKSGGYSEEEICYRFEYREQYIPGTSEEPGRVTTSRGKVEVPCDNRVGTQSDLTQQYPTRNSNHNPHVGEHEYLAHSAPVYQPYPVQGYGRSGPVIINNDRYQPPQQGYNQYSPQNQAYNPYEPQRQSYQQSIAPEPQGDTNSCAAGTVLGAIAGGAGAFAATNGGKYSQDSLWTVPLGMIGGSMVGCRLNGG